MTKNEFISRYGEEKYLSQLQKQKDKYYQKANYFGKHDKITVCYLTSSQKITVDNYELLDLKEHYVEKRV